MLPAPPIVPGPHRSPVVSRSRVVRRSPVVEIRRVAVRAGVVLFGACALTGLATACSGGPDAPPTTSSQLAPQTSVRGPSGSASPSTSEPGNSTENGPTVGSVDADRPANPAPS